MSTRVRGRAGTPAPARKKFFRERWPKGTPFGVQSQLMEGSCARSASASSERASWDEPMRWLTGPRRRPFRRCRARGSSRSRTWTRGAPTGRLPSTVSSARRPTGARSSMIRRFRPRRHHDAERAAQGDGARRHRCRQARPLREAARAERRRRADDGPGGRRGGRGDAGRVQLPEEPLLALAREMIEDGELGTITSFRAIHAEGFMAIPTFRTRGASIHREAPGRWAISAATRSRWRGTCWETSTPSGGPRDRHPRPADPRGARERGRRSSSTTSRGWRCASPAGARGRSRPTGWRRGAPCNSPSTCTGAAER